MELYLHSLYANCNVGDFGCNYAFYNRDREEILLIRNYHKIYFINIYKIYFLFILKILDHVDLSSKVVVNLDDNSITDHEVFVH
jgi:hypothetical protein